MEVGSYSQCCAWLRGVFVTNNAVLRSVQQIFDIDDSEMVNIFALAEYQVAPESVAAWLKNDEEPGFQACNDTHLAIFLNGLINDQRGKKEGLQPEPEQSINNNIVFRKLKIALDLQADDILEILESADVHLSKHELSALFRKPGHKHYRACSDQVLHGFIEGVRLRY